MADAEGVTGPACATVDVEPAGATGASVPDAPPVAATMSLR
ncbi:hypothetical protein P355_0335 [Burkholderia cenocepacia KC-01]|nr:hypothetical protein P355_0335 [Burkholderia cenocepacia KC-01]